MADRSRLTDDQIQQGLSDLPGWKLEDNQLRRDYQFASFVHAFAFMTAAALEAEALNHHPDWSNVYSKVKVALWTHDRDGVTGLDLKLAGKFEAIAARFLAREN